MSRERLILSYVRGSGIEIGAGHCPMPVAEGVRVTYVDRLSYDELKLAHQTPDMQPPRDIGHVVDDGETLSTLPDESQDFIIASHVLEHCHDPIGTIKNWLRVVRPGGLIWMAIPEKRGTFDRVRPVTSFDHLLQDHVLGPHVSAEGHYREWFSLVERRTGDDLEQKVARALKENTNIHFHVFDEDSQIALIEGMSPRGYTIVKKELLGWEMVWLLKKNEKLLPS